MNREKVLPQLHENEMLDELSCHRCGYDVRAQPTDGKCPECSASVAESRRLAAIPRRPAWRDRDPRWRRRMVIGMWILVLMPLMDTLMASGVASNVPVPTVLDYRGSLTLEDTFLCQWNVFPSLMFCIGMVLLYSRETGRRRGRLFLAGSLGSAIWRSAE